MRVGVFPGSFRPLTIAHLAVADTGRDALGLHRVEFVLSVQALGKTEPGDLDARLAELRSFREARPWLDVAVTEARLIAEIAEGYDAVLMGADKWAQVLDPAWYGGSEQARDAAVASLPEVGVAPRAGHPWPEGAHVLPVPEELWEVSATAVRAGRHDWRARPR